MGSTIIFSKNSSLSRKGYKSSIGLEIIVPSGFFKEETLGINGWFSLIIISHTIGPGVFRIESIFVFNSSVFPIVAVWSPYAAATLMISGQVTPELFSAPTNRPKWFCWVDFIVRYPLLFNTNNFLFLLQVPLFFHLVFLRSLLK